ncbi:PaaI family thioesterase [Spongiibacter sp. KMU-158]|uniref:PaaI family thioesterase n=2 Tax=Spongiibacter pelagi TaxID=2760804 RepID=A0A927C4A5_9GAMM|nr:PaaI family thioesterase [Spongiibacter pelagi]
MNAEQLAVFFKQEFPQAEVLIEQAGGGFVRLRKPIDERHLRPGGTVSGPVMMEMADAALYAAILSELGPVALAVTTNLNINFLRKPSADKDIIADCRLIKLGKLLAIGEVTIYSVGNDEPVAHATGTYAIPPK